MRWNGEDSVLNASIDNHINDIEEETSTDTNCSRRRAIFARLPIYDEVYEDRNYLFGQLQYLGRTGWAGWGLLTASCLVDTIIFCFMYWLFMT